MNSKNFLPFTKMHGLGNDFVILDCRAVGLMPPQSIMAAMTNRKTGIGCDQLIPLLPAENKKAAVFMRIINSPDATEAQACGNATRCVARFLMDEKNTDKITIQTVAGLLECEAVNGDRSIVQVDMGVPQTEWQKIPVANECDTLDLPLQLDGINAVGVNIGNPHAVFFIEDDIESFPVKTLGPKYETDPLFPEKANIEFARIIDRETIRMRVWERDSGETNACGSAACATVVAAVRKGLANRKCRVLLNGGDLSFDWQKDGHLLMTGAAAYVYDGKYYLR